LERRALTDPLTGLPNRTLLRDRLEQAIATGQRQGTPVALLWMDLDGFKAVNDTFGHGGGDELLRQLGPRVKAQLRESDTVARLGGDEFAVLLPTSASQAAAVATARKIAAEVERPFVIEGQLVEVRGSVGVALSPQHGSDAESLMRRADAAMYVAKRSGTGLAVYSAEQEQRDPALGQLLAELRQALPREELRLLYQPAVDLATGRVVGVEALLRWQHPTQGLLGPESFLAHAERTGLVGPIGRWAVDRALRQCEAWRSAGIDLSVGVNLSLRSLGDPELAGEVASLLRRLDVPASALKVELSERDLGVDPARSRRLLGDLAGTGARLVVDDFGTGDLSLRSLRELPVSELKVDRSLVARAAGRQEDLALVRAAIGLAHDLGLLVTAEGVEDEETAALLAELGCDLAQGFYFAAAMAARAITQLVSAGPVFGELLPRAR
ncbi:MAG: putative bifunctional diguanylate cyclase/phosphodiesterase, partial [Candidatus Limnocylindria bacterium]